MALTRTLESAGIVQTAASAPRLAQIVSPPFACGVAWLINALLYLDIRVTNTVFEPGHWQTSDDSWHMSDAAEAHLKWHLPVLHERQSFSFPEALHIRWEHRLDFAASEARPTILFVRDPRDAVYSLYRRSYAERMSFLGYLNRPDIWPDHFPGLFQMPPMESFAYFSWYWQAMAEAMPVKLVRFEDVKASPVETLRDVLQFLGIARSDEELHAAAESSGFEKARQAMQQMESDTGKTFKTARKGQVGEWRQSYSFLARVSIRNLGRAMIAGLGYAEDKGGPVSEQIPKNWRDQLSQGIPPALRSLVTAWLEATEHGKGPGFQEMATAVREQAIAGKDLLRLGAIVEAIFYVQRIFADTASPQARIALNTFVNLNLFYFDQWPVQVAAWSGLRRLETETGAPILQRLGNYQQYRLRILNRMWKLNRIGKLF